MDPESPVVQLCVAGMQREAEGRTGDAAALFQQAWASRRDAYEACIAAHYVARHQDAPANTLWWNEESLRQANAVPERVAGFLPSLHLNIAHSHEVLGNFESARHHYELAESYLVDMTGGDGYSDVVRRGISNGLQRVSAMEGRGAAGGGECGPDDGVVGGR